jgi:hypothetical protein
LHPLRTLLDPADSMTRQAPFPQITEKEFMGQVLDLARMFGWRVAHFRPALTSRGWRTPVQADGAGFPDLLMARGSRLVAAELKREKGSATTPDQDAWLAALAAAGCEAFLWRPSDFDLIVATLRPSSGSGSVSTSSERKAS